jgi:multiple antibiotic resistance protein
MSAQVSAVASAGTTVPAELVSAGKFFWEAFITLLVITDPPGVVPVFLGMTSGRPKPERNQLAWQAALVAAGVIVAFALFGRSILAYLGVELPSLQAAGGLLLLLVALQLLTGHAADPAELERSKANVAFVPLGTPLLAGPGAIVATMLFVQRVSTVADGIAFAAAIVAVVAMLWLAMRFSGVILRVLKDSGVELLTRIAGLLLSAIAVQLIVGAVRDLIRIGI